MQAVPEARLTVAANRADWLKRRAISRQRWRDEIGVSQQFGASARHPAAERRCDPGAVGHFQRQNKIAADAAVENGGAGAAIAGRGLDADGAERPGLGLDFKWRAAAGAIGCGDKADLAPALGAEPPRHVDRRIAGAAM